MAKLKVFMELCFVEMELFLESLKGFKGGSPHHVSKSRDSYVVPPAETLQGRHLGGGGCHAKEGLTLLIYFANPKSGRPVAIPVSLCDMPGEASPRRSCYTRGIGEGIRLEICAPLHTLGPSMEHTTIR